MPREQPNSNIYETQKLWRYFVAKTAKSCFFENRNYSNSLVMKHIHVRRTMWTNLFLNVPLEIIFPNKLSEGLHLKQLDYSWSGHPWYEISHFHVKWKVANVRCAVFALLQQCQWSPIRSYGNEDIVGFIYWSQSCTKPTNRVQHIQQVWNNTTDKFTKKIPKIWKCLLWSFTELTIFNCTTSLKIRGSLTLPTLTHD